MVNTAGNTRQLTALKKSMNYINYSLIDTDIFTRKKRSDVILEFNKTLTEYPDTRKEDYQSRLEMLNKQRKIGGRFGGPAGM